MHIKRLTLLAMIIVLSTSLISCKDATTQNTKEISEVKEATTITDEKPKGKAIIAEQRHDSNTTNDDAPILTNAKKKKLNEEIVRIKESLKFGQYTQYLSPTSEQKHIITRTEGMFHDPASLKNKISDINLPTQIMEGSFDSAFLFIKDFEKDISKNIEVGKVYSLDHIKTKDIASLHLYYLNKEGIGLQLMIHPVPPDEDGIKLLRGSELATLEEQRYNDQTYYVRYFEEIGVFTASFIISIDGIYYIIETAEIEKVDGNSENPYIVISKINEKDKLFKLTETLPLDQIISEIGL